MRRAATAILIALLAGGCSGEETMALTEVEANATPIAFEPDANGFDLASTPHPCVDTEGYDTCLVGTRGTPDKPCFEFMAYLQGATEREVRAEPRADAKVLGRIYGDSPGEDGRPATFEVRDSRDGWLLIEGAADDTQLTGADRAMYSGRGWIRGEGVGFGAQASQVFTKPDFAGEIAAEGEWFDGLPAEAVLGCDGSWVHARWKIVGLDRMKVNPQAVVSRNPLIVEGWVTGVCNVQETTCDGLNGNRPGVE
jgi:hypothetical protein